jgi:hypothetical protein
MVDAERCAHRPADAEHPGLVEVERRQLLDRRKLDIDAEGLAHATEVTLVPLDRARDREIATREHHAEVDVRGARLFHREHEVDQAGGRAGRGVERDVAEVLEVVERPVALDDLGPVEHVALGEGQLAPQHLLRGLLVALEDDLLYVRLVVLDDVHHVADALRRLVAHLAPVDLVEDVAVLGIEVHHALEIVEHLLAAHGLARPLCHQGRELLGREDLVALEAHARVGVLVALDHVDGDHQLILPVRGLDGLLDALDPGVEEAVVGIVVDDLQLVRLELRGLEHAGVEQRRRLRVHLAAQRALRSPGVAREPDLADLRLRAFDHREDHLHAARRVGGFRARADRDVGVPLVEVQQPDRLLVGAQLRGADQVAGLHQHLLEDVGGPHLGVARDQDDRCRGPLRDLELDRHPARGAVGVARDRVEPLEPVEGHHGVLQPLEQVVAERLPEVGFDHRGQVHGFHVDEAHEHHVRDRLVEVPFPGLLGGQGGEDAGEQHGDDHGAAKVGHATGSLSEVRHQ